MSYKTTRIVLTTAATLSLTTLMTMPALAADAPAGLFLRGAESLGDLSNPKLTVPLEVINPGPGCNSGDGADSVQCGINSDASGSSATALGANTIASGVGGTAVGNNADAVGALSTAIGVHANTDGIGLNAIGLRANASGNFSNALGRNANASGTGATAIGLDSAASGDYAQALGRNANASGPASISIGVNSQAAAPDTIAIGNGASANFANSVAIGNDAAASRTNQIVLGSDTTTYTLAGITSAASRGQQGAVVGLLTTDANGNLASDGGALQASVADHEIRITGLEQTIDEGLNETAGGMPGGTTGGTSGGSTGIEPVVLTPNGPVQGQTASLNANTPITEARSVAEPAPNSLYGSNLSVAPLQNTTNAADIATNAANIATNSGNIATNAQNIALTSERVTVNSQRIAANSANITENAQNIQLAFGSIENNSQSIIRNTEEIAELTSGLAAVTALPDMHLSPDTKWAASGGVGFYGDDVGVGATLAIRASNNIAFGASVASAGERATGKLQVRYEGF